MHKERPILFSGPMVRAILDGRKTQTRRALQPQPATASDGRHLGWKKFAAEFCRYGVPGDTLWVRETWQHEDTACEDHRCGQPTHIYHKATEVAPETFARWRPSIYMPRWASRLTLEVTDVRIERVQEISVDDAIAEGVWIDPPDAHGFRSGVQRAFQELWDSLNAKRGFGFEANPWVWALTFKRIN